MEVNGFKPLSIWTRRSTVSNRSPQRQAKEGVRRRSSQVDRANAVVVEASTVRRSASATRSCWQSSSPASRNGLEPLVSKRSGLPANGGIREGLHESLQSNVSVRLGSEA